ncbi:hypothetical protein GOEFS_077_00580, partial [Gordonia effusa NBRC 100432]
GGLVVRAAAYEERVKRVVCYGIMADILDVQLHAIPEAMRAELLQYLTDGAVAELNDFVSRATSSSLLLQWALTQGRHVTGKQTPFEIFNAYRAYETASVSPLVTQDVLLLHGDGDHYIPNRQLVDQIAALTQVHSLTARVFTALEYGQNHCQVGNYGLALNEITSWLDRLRRRDDVFAEVPVPR